jgi:DNA-directed RNA polymerase specialized sigma24 family protein
VTVSEPTAARLRAIARQRRAAKKKRDEIEAEMRRAVIEARAEGGNLREISDLLGISHTAVAKIERRAKGKR